MKSSKRKTRSKKDLENLKKELVLDVHIISTEALFGRLNADPTSGLTTVQAKARLLENGPNELTPPATTSEWVRFCKQLFGGFQILLWIGAFLCLLAFGIQITQFDSPPLDNVCSYFVFSIISSLHFSAIRCLNFLFCRIR